MSKSLEAAKRLAQLYKDHPELFDDPDVLYSHLDGHPSVEPDDELLVDDDNYNVMDEDPIELARYGYRRRYYE